MAIAPTAIPIAVPTGPAFGRNVVPGMTKAPHPTMKPNDSAQAEAGERYLISPFSFCLSKRTPSFRKDTHIIIIAHLPANYNT